MHRYLILGLVLLASASGFFSARLNAPPIPPENAIKLSEIIAKIEQRDQFVCFRDRLGRRGLLRCDLLHV